MYTLLNSVSLRSCHTRPLLQQGVTSTFHELFESFIHPFALITIGVAAIRQQISTLASFASHLQDAKPADLSLATCFTHIKQLAV